MMKNKIKNIRYLLEYFLVYLIYLFLSFLPINVVSYIGGLIFRIIGPLTKTNTIAKKNYLRIFPLAKPYEVKKDLIKSWDNVGKTFFELLILPKITSPKKNKIEIVGENILMNLKEKNKKLIFFGIHQSNWEIIVPTIDRIGFNIGAIYRHINNPYIDKLILDRRNKSISSIKSFYTPKGRKSAKDIIAGIKDNSSMLVIIDQKDSAGENIPFFGINVKTQTGFLKIAKKNKMKIIPVENTRIGTNNFKLKFHPPLDIGEDNLSSNQFMEKIHNIIESWIKKNPSNWFMQHNRFN